MVFWLSVILAMAASQPTAPSPVRVVLAAPFSPPISEIALQRAIALYLGGAAIAASETDAPDAPMRVRIEMAPNRRQLLITIVDQRGDTPDELVLNVPIPNRPDREFYRRLALRIGSLVHLSPQAQDAVESHAEGALPTIAQAADSAPRVEAAPSHRHRLRLGLSTSALLVGQEPRGTMGLGGFVGMDWETTGLELSAHRTDSFRTVRDEGRGSVVLNRTALEVRREFYPGHDPWTLAAAAGLGAHFVEVRGRLDATAAQRRGHLWVGIVTASCTAALRVAQQWHLSLQAGADFFPVDTRVRLQEQLLYRTGGLQPWMKLALQWSQL